MTTDNQRYQAMLEAPEEIKKLYDSYDTGAFLGEFFRKRTLDPQIGTSIVGDTILGFHKISDMPRLFQQKLGLSADESQRTTSQLVDFLSPVLKQEELEANTKKEELTKLTNTFSSPEAISRKENGEDMSLEKIEPVRTMAQDMSRVHGYGAYRALQENDTDEAIVSSQDTILNKQKDRPE